MGSGIRVGSGVVESGKWLASVALAGQLLEQVGGQAFLNATFLHTIDTKKCFWSYSVKKTERNLVLGAGYWYQQTWVQAGNSALRCVDG